MATTPIVTEVTKAQLDALVAANGLNEGLQYFITDYGYRVLATSSSAYIFLNNSPYKAYEYIVSQVGENNVIEIGGYSDFPPFILTRNSAGNYSASVDFLVENKTVSFPFAQYWEIGSTNYLVSFQALTDEGTLQLTTSVNGVLTDGVIYMFPISFKVYY